MTASEVAARRRIAELYAATPPAVAQAKIDAMLKNPDPRGAYGPHGPLGVYVCAPAEMYADHLEGCLYCLRDRWHFFEAPIG